jgi:hypothetical protein
MYNGNPHAPTTAWLASIVDSHTAAADLAVGDTDTETFSRDGATFNVTVTKVAGPDDVDPDAAADPDPDGTHGRLDTAFVVADKQTTVYRVATDKAFAGAEAARLGTTVHTAPIDHTTLDAAPDGGLDRLVTTNPFIVEHAVPKDDAVTYCMVDFDAAYHPAGGIWFPSDVDFDPDTSGQVRHERDLPTGEVIQYPVDDRPPRVVGTDTLPGWVADRVTPEYAEGDQ